MKTLIFGLGNPGAEYAHTRHNIGFDIIDKLANEIGTEFQVSKNAVLAEGRIKNKTMVLLKPTTYMNLSGKAVAFHLSLYKCKPENILVLCDDLSLGTGTIRIRMKGSHGGHNGLRNIEETLQTQDYPRLRFGIGSDFDKNRQIDFVLGHWKSDESELVKQNIMLACDAIRSFVLEGPGIAMTQYNRK